MNKLKFLYDVVKTLKEQPAISGIATGEVQKNHNRIFFVENKFEQNFLTMHTKIVITKEIDYDGKEVKHQGTTEFVSHSHGLTHPHQDFGPMRLHSMGGRGLKAKLNALAFAFHLINTLQIEEQEDKTFLVTLEISEWPDECKALFQERAECTGPHHFRHYTFVKDLCSLEKGTFSFAMTVGEDYTIESIAAAFDGHTGQAEAGNINVMGNIQLSYPKSNTF